MENERQPMLKKLCGYNLRERLNVYAGLALGIGLPSALMKYACIKPASDDWKTHLICGLLAMGLAIPYMIFTVPAGLVAGITSANELSKGRLRESQLNELTQGVNKNAAGNCWKTF